MHGTPTSSFASLGPILGCARLDRWAFFYWGSLVPSGNRAKNSSVVELEHRSVLSILNPRLAWSIARLAPDKRKGELVQMTVHVPEPSHYSEHPQQGRRQQAPDERLVLSELNPVAVVDGLDGDGVPLNLITFGDVREVCPNCSQHLKLVLRQAHVRMAHLLCPGCARCFDAHYANGTPALTI
jgi:hypothetical protein